MNKKMYIGLGLMALGVVLYFITDKPADIQATQNEIREEQYATSSTETSLTTVPTNTFTMHTNEENRTVLDVRTPAEFTEGHLPNAQNIDFYADGFMAELEALDRTAPYAIYCRSGNRSGQALTVMRDLGFTDVVDLDGGIVAWVDNGRGLCTNC